MTIYRATVLALLIALVIGTVELTARTAALDLRHQRTGTAVPEMKIVDIRRSDFERLLWGAATELDATLGLGPDDEIVAVQDRRVTPGRAAGAALAVAAGRHPSASFIDIGVNRRGRLIRVIVLLHDA